MAPIEFTVTHQFDASAKLVWDEMVDWPAHGQWIPATRVEIAEESGDGLAVGAMITGYTGYGPLTLVDRMRISTIDHDQATGEGTCEVEKLGPVLRGRAGFSVTAEGTCSRVDWFEEVTVPYLPRLLAPVVNKLSAAGFSMGMRRLAKIIEKKQTSQG